MLVALLLRRSTNDELQADSLRVQEQVLRHFAKTNSHTIVRTYKESASGRQIAGRDVFQSLLDDVRRGAPYEAILVRDVSRWGRFENPDESAFYEFFCQLHGVRVIYVEEPFEGESSPYAALMKSIKRVLAAEFSREKAHLVQSSQARVVREGFMHGGPAPFGMRRILVRMDGAYLHNLSPGDRKTLGNTRVKLAPGDAAQAAVVQRIFHEYADLGRSLEEIACDLRKDGSRGTRGGTWSPGRVSYILCNPVYAGMLRYTRTDGDTRSQMYNYRDDHTNERVVLTRGAHQGIVPEEQWERAHDRIRGRTRRQTNADLARELSLAFTKWGFVSEQVVESVGVSWDTYANRFERGYQEALEFASRDVLSATAAAVRAHLAAYFTLENLDEGWLVEGALHVRVKHSFPRAGRHGLHWEFTFSGTEPEDVTIGLAFAPVPTLKHVETFIFHTQRLRRVPHRRRPRVIAQQSRKDRRFGPDASLEHAIRYALFWQCTASDRLLIDALRGQALVNLSAVARTLQWPQHVVATRYERLVARGVALPPLQRKPGRRITVTCPDCLSARQLRPSQALQLTTHLCITCQRERYRHLLRQGRPSR